MRLTITGGGGYLGSHAVRALLDAGHRVTVIDDLSTGHRDAIDPRARFVQAPVGEADGLDRALDGAEAVLHFAARSVVSESFAERDRYWAANVDASARLLEGMHRCGVERLLFSSSAATYGRPEHLPITEEAPQRPVSPYGETKLAVERLLAEHASRHPGFGYAALRYFNVAGCAWGLGERHDPETHLVPIVLETALGLRPAVRLHGTDWPTPDGTCVRDLLHVRDLVDAHRVVLAALGPGDRRVYNVGSGRGWSVREVVEAARRLTGAPIPVVEAPRRQGDPPILVTDPSRLARELGWVARHSGLDEILSSHWQWLRTRSAVG